MKLPFCSYGTSAVQILPLNKNRLMRLYLAIPIGKNTVLYRKNYRTLWNSHFYMLTEWPIPLVCGMLISCLNVTWENQITNNPRSKMLVIVTITKWHICLMSSNIRNSFELLLFLNTSLHIFDLAAACNNINLMSHPVTLASKQKPLLSVI